ncbi:hypothetical protein P3X46_019619 [Hevea brasiliensis]|uniref:DUF4005 domain-containing protein n=1 Tax=Hevea brasiliensis TaxID=3981 RepID=A0ABQ9LKL6_HEVBR|nr:protein OXIDATIVE STRESS 3 LIKE 1 [Hevea brasiliensis]KAJ9168045.1 hypothetical protein P3X46_019619 [Hevea brasiliensis]
MSIAFQTSGDCISVQRSAFIHRMPPFMGAFSGDRRFPAAERREDDLDDSSSSLSIGRNSDLSGGEDSGQDCDESEVQSLYKGPLDSMVALEEVLPIKRGISKFYNGKSKSFTSLADASSASSIKDFAKPENPYNRKRKNQLARNNFWDKNCNYPPKDDASGISKRPANSNRSTSALCSTMNCSKSNSKREDSHPLSSLPSCLPPLHPQGKSSLNNESCSPLPQRSSHWRSFSLSDLQCATAAAHNS